MRWVFYAALLLLFFMIMSGGFFRRWQPVFIVPLAIAVATQEREFGAAIFAVFCGFMLDIACGNLFGMSSIWLMPCALAASLLIMHLIKPNFINHAWLTALTCLIMAFMEYFFKYVVWDTPNSNIILRDFIIPSYFSAILFSPGVFFLIKFVSMKLRGKESGELTDIIEIDSK